MSEGPQVKLITERLQRQLRGKVILACSTTRTDLEDFTFSVQGSAFEHIFCKGKQIFFGLNSGQFLYNHLLMRGKWRRSRDRFLLLPPEIWIAFEVAGGTVYNYMGQILKILDSEQTRAQLDSLGPDVMSAKCTDEAIADALSRHEQPLGELLLDQSVLSGIGNVAKSESLHMAGIHPEAKAGELRQDTLAKLAGSIRQVMWDSYHSGGRWTHRVYRRAKDRCFECGTRIAFIRQGRQKRATYFCPKCQPRT